ncbi:DeoR family transcriptional regulator [Catellatospora methionotrophica]|uniref:DeoR family transcriptional regulator n=1 Tax=Catellatospora methionotrophica TaxID=121620 RepID=A0A8J3PHR6_9ACTN|nr:DeoR/GlpR family DNA-binding transcription regulator [Catellatospora methionotrophica]GIG18151.1 DeoR family transcriptional regulator [Catellatospora methionotrophica]
MAKKAGARDPSSRQQMIADHVMSEGTAVAQELAEQFGVSLVTMHRDLDELVRRGIVRKYRGGVTALPSSVFESNVTFRLNTAVPEKQAIAQLTRSLVEPGMSVLLDDSTTTLAIAEALRDISPLIIITNFMPIIRLVVGWDDVHLISLGGEYNPMHDSFIGVPCAQAAQSLRADVGFFSFSGIDNAGVYHQEQEVVFTKRAMIGAAARRIVVVDHTKLNRTALHRVAPLTDFEQVVTDDKAPSTVVEGLRRQINVLVASPPHS